MKRIILTISILTLTISSGFSQTPATTEDGEKVILNKDGTWKYAEKEKEKVEQVAPPKSRNDCGAYIKTEVDKVTGDTIIQSKEPLLILSVKDGVRAGLGIGLIKSSGWTLLTIGVVGVAACIDDDDKMNVLFRDGTRLELINGGKFNCDGAHTQVFGGTLEQKENLEMFRTKEIETIRVWTSRGYREENFTPKQSKELMNVVDCLSRS